jgi:hypothetical protein
MTTESDRILRSGAASNDLANALGRNMRDGRQYGVRLEIEVTQAMIEAGLLPYMSGDPEIEPREEIVARIICAALDVRPSSFREDKCR